jgi:ABC-type multidrug transport system fused ATPase/permease subunit
LGWLRNNIGYVGQEPVLFAGSIKDNLLLYAPEASDQDIEAALKNAEIYDFIHKELTKGLDTYVGVGGRMISGGQKQRLAIARALLKKPRLMIFDEATSALDKLNEKKVLINLQRLPYELRTIAVSHRVQVSEIADYVYVLEDGRIVEDGKFNEL